MDAWLSAFLFTQVVEIPIYLLALRRRKGPRGAALQRFVIAFGASALTHPLVWFLFPRLVPEPYPLMVAVAEAFAVTAEAIYLARFGVPRPVILSLAANGASLTLGLGSRALFGWP